ncbi:hypothetical protein E1162_12150 [Rhodobacteraceae bacterium RKSG542]|uniref:beta strand repeat-containing protein n=1 Tax=Pseudovibrio flavus TaxID=2529854 RepID=UPI0012BD0A9A|nr:hypothetical protein [Pseudovibrio flavus]MTI17989.1 hypothetical protein [Pseudovibrio flavus]
MTDHTTNPTTPPPSSTPSPSSGSGSEPTPTITVDLNSDGTDSNLSSTQFNGNNDHDRLINAEVENNAAPTQTVGVDGGTAHSRDGIDDTSGADVVGDDMSVSGASAASADGAGYAEAFNQDISMGGNAQSNSLNASIVGGDYDVSASGGDGASFNNGEQTQLASDGTDTALGGSQVNELSDVDIIGSVTVPDNAATVQNNGTLHQDVDVNGGTATAESGIESLRNDDVVLGGDSGSSGLISVGDDLSIAGTTSASADALGVANAFNQELSTGGNQQSNSADVSVVGTDVNIASAGGSDAAVPGAIGSTGQSDTDTYVHLTQANGGVTGGGAPTPMNDQDLIYDPTVNNGSGNSLDQDVDVTGGTSNAHYGINSVAHVGSAGGGDGGDSSISGSAEASADASAYAFGFNQTLSTGGNMQTNAADMSVVGNNQNGASAGENDAHNSHLGVVPAGVEPDTDTDVHLYQSNDLDDDDYIQNPTLTNDGTVTQDVVATGGDATARDGIRSDSVDENLDTPILGSSVVGDDSSITGSSSASADASAVASAFGQNIGTAGNWQGNGAEIDVTGGDSNLVSTGEDNTVALGSTASAPSTPAAELADNSTDSVLHVSQDNDLSDADYVNTPTLQNNGNVAQNVTADGGNAGSGNGIRAESFIGAHDVGDDSSVAGTTSASADSVGQASAFNQNISTGGNTQVNQSAIDIVGASENMVSIGADSEAHSGNLFSGLRSNDADSDIHIQQNNDLADNDRITDPSVEHASGASFSQNVSVGEDSDPETGVATTGHGIYDDYTKDFDPSSNVGGDYSITAEAMASADATGSAFAFNQNLSVGSNTQVNAASADVTGDNDTYLFTDGDSTLGSGLAALDVIPVGADEVGGGGVDANGTDSAFTIEQANALNDQDVITNPSVVNNGASFSQTVDVLGGTATAGDGILDAEALFDVSVGDDYTVDALSSASADAVGVANAFNQNIVMGANVQANSVDIGVVGGSSTVNVVGEDDLA